MRFNAGTLGTGNTPVNNDLQVVFANSNNTLTIKNESLKATVESVALFNILGQNVQNWDIENQTQEMIQIPVKNISAGTYIVKLKTTTGTMTKKIVIK
ncbi:T9SS type A sorting domain-containing protein [Flavobacterium sp. 3HN19-14]|uniref:T9SS type A sorting domain-containing protein n=1 Tax=Flavobacterium sp. 3HN19-14 TaxID=3448133 RepID=UPI003EE1FC5A